jgi:Mg-chelatase subunit ChlD
MQKESTLTGIRALCIVPVGLLGALAASAVGCGSAETPGSGISYGGAAGTGAGTGGSSAGAGANAGASGGSSGGTIGIDGSLGAGGSGGSGTIDPDASCANDVRQGGVVQVNMLVMFDRSGSMDDEIDNNQTRWDAASSALNAFFRDPNSAGLDVALRFFPHDEPMAGCNNDDCNENACAQELVPIAPLTADPAPGDTQEQALVAAVTAAAPTGDGQGGGTPTYAALAGAEAWATAHQAAHPNERTVVVFVTDGEPNGCIEETAAIAALAQAARTSSGVLTYAIGISDGVDDGIMDPIAAAGGTNQAIMIEDGSAQSSLLTALQNIRGQVLSCNFVMPPPRDPGQPIDPTRVNVNYTPSGGGTPTLVGGVNSAADCGSTGGWYYDNPSLPTQIILCPATCATVQADPSPQIQVVLGGVWQPPPPA